MSEARTLPRKTEERAGDNTHQEQSKLVCADALSAKHEFRTLARFLDSDPRASHKRNKESDSLFEPTLCF